MSWGDAVGCDGAATDAGAAGDGAAGPEGRDESPPRASELSEPGSAWWADPVGADCVRDDCRETGP
ncbi:hypothetical protein, partial [Saccharomonospora azurea]